MRRAGTLLEVVTASALFLLLAGLALGICLVMQAGVQEGATRVSLGTRAAGLRRLLERELRNVVASSVRLSSLRPDGTYGRLQYRQASGYDPEADQLQLGPLRELRFELEAGESAARPGLDDDRDGLVDEGDLIAGEDQDGDGTIAVGEARRVLAGDLAGDEFGFRLASGADAVQPLDRDLTLRWGLQRRLPRGERAVYLVELRLALRN